MLRGDVQKKIGLTRKAIEYYEEKGFIHPKKLENGYRDYGKEDLEVLKKISLFRRLGMTMEEIGKCLSSEEESLSSVLRRKQHQLEMEEKRKEMLELYLKGGSPQEIEEKLALLEGEESVYQRLERAFPGYFGQMFFAAYQPFLGDPLEKEGEEAFAEYMEYLDYLPPFALSKEERAYIEEMSSTIDMETLKEVGKEKLAAIENPKDWFKDHKEAISQYEAYKNSPAYENSQMKDIQDKLKKYMKENKYYERGLPLIRKFSRSYDDYYKKLIRANEEYLKNKLDEEKTRNPGPENNF